MQTFIELLRRLARLLGLAKSLDPLSDLARRVEPRIGVEGPALTEAQTFTRKEIVTRARVDDDAATIVFFSGASGTGKAEAAESLARDLGRDLYRVDLSRVVSKYIGETEKNLNQLLRAAESADGVLFFDESDPLFGKRSEVKDAHDRYANIEVNYLLQRLETYRGLAILATNEERTFARVRQRIQFELDFPQLPCK